MKKYLFMLLWTACAVACSDSDPAPQPDDEGPTPPPDKEQQVVCGIEKPEEGASVNLAEKLTIAGTGVATVGKIEKVVLKVGGIVVPEVTDVPFEIEYTFPAEQAEGELKLELSVEGDAGATASTEVTVTTYRKEGPAAPVEGTMTDARDGNVYKTVKLADQVWMAENLRYLPEQHDDVSDTEPRYYIWSDYDKDTQLGAEALKVYGAFYNWKAALQGEEPQTSADQAPIRGVCPEGWHIPSQAEWQQLAQYVLDADMAAVGSNGEVDETAIAKALAMDYPDDELTWNLPSMIEGDPQPTWPGIDKSKNNATKFSGIPIGFRSYSFNPADGGVQWDHASYSAGWWSSTQGVMGEGYCAVVRMWSDNQRFATDSNFIGGVGLTVRCLQD